MNFSRSEICQLSAFCLMGLNVRDIPAVHLEVTSKDNLHNVCTDVSVGLGEISERIAVLLHSNTSHFTVFPSPQMNPMQSFYFYCITRRALPKSVLFFMDDSSRKPIPPAMNDKVLYFSFLPLTAHLIKVWRLHSRATHSLATAKKSPTSTPRCLTSCSVLWPLSAALVTFRCQFPSFGVWISNWKLMNAVGVLDKGFVTAAEPVMEQKLSLNVALFTLLSLPALCLSVRKWPLWWLIISLSTTHGLHCSGSTLFKAQYALSNVKPWKSMCSFLFISLSLWPIDIFCLRNRVLSFYFTFVHQIFLELPVNFV